MDNKKFPQSTCAKCQILVDATGVGSATGRLYYHCPQCGVEWAGKNAAAITLGSIGGKKSAEAHTPEERRKKSSRAAIARWRKAKKLQA